MEYTNDVTMRWLSQAHPHPSPSTSANLMYRPAESTAVGAQFQLVDTEIADENRNGWCFSRPYLDMLEALREFGFIVHADWSNDNEGKLDSDMSVEELLFGGD